MSTFPTLNRRRSAGLFLVLIAAGLSLFLEASAKQTAGIVLLGMAFVWVIGSNSRPVHLLLAAIGSFLLLAPICYDWYDHRGALKSYQSRVEEFENRIDDLSKKYPFEKTSVDSQTGARMGWNGAMWVVIAPGSSKHKIGEAWDGKDWFPSALDPPWLSKALQGNVNVDAVPDYMKPNYFPPVPFSIVSSFLSRGVIELPGLALLCVAVGLLVGIKAQT